ncbi:class I SAM-dependent methyltransferase [Salinirubrum litoreum]|uniref:Class I SAM-dependent methyltransferase n=1 Tax=Salinirubrum litoreum TaxID=1126234 RepID=A0ABD5RDU3_9EURY|nr:class I SAM-dependent methyltransferase [Salinirubrum litoreum]
MPTRDTTDLPPEALTLLWAARETGVVDAVTTDAGTPEAVADAADVTEQTARVAVRSLAELGFLRRVGEEYEPTNRALGLLAKRDVRSIGRLPHALDVQRYLRALPETMRTGDPPDEPPDWTRNRLGAVEATDEATVRACVTAAIREAPDAERVLDVRGGSGRYAREVVARGRSATLFESSEVCGVVAPLLAPTDVSLVAGDLDSPPVTDPATDDPFDLALTVDLLRRLDPDSARALFAGLAEVLAPEGCVVLLDAFRELADADSAGSASATDSEGQTPVGADVGVDPAVGAGVACEQLALGSGDAHATAQVCAWLSSPTDGVGFEEVTARRVPGTARVAVIGRGPYS